VTSIGEIGEVVRNVEAFSSQISAAMEKQSSVTQEISRTVEESTLAAREVASQIVKVSSEAVETGRRAAEIRDGSADIARKVDGLRATLVRVVRTSTADVNRRISARVEVERPGMLEVGGRSCKIMVRNLSDGGAMVIGSLPEVALGTRAILAIDGFAPRLGGTIGRRDEHGAMVGFELSETTQRLVKDLIAGRNAA
jgi:methyl-accepting chemotaxis protein